MKKKTVGLLLGLLLLTGCGTISGTAITTPEVEQPKATEKQVVQQTKEPEQPLFTVVEENVVEESFYNLYENDTLIYSNDVADGLVDYMVNEQADYTIELKVFDLVGEEVLYQQPEYITAFDNTFPKANSITVVGHYYKTGNFVVDGYATKTSIVDLGERFELSCNTTFVDCSICVDDLRLKDCTLTTEGTFCRFNGIDRICDGSLVFNTSFETDLSSYSNISNVDITLNKASAYIYGNNTEVQIWDLNICELGLFAFYYNFYSIKVDSVHYPDYLGDLRFSGVVCNDITIREVVGGIKDAPYVNYLWFETLGREPAYIKVTEKFEPRVDIFYSSGGFLTASNATGEVLSETNYEFLPLDKPLMEINNPDFLSLVREFKIQDEHSNNENWTFVNNQLIYVGA